VFTNDRVGNGEPARAAAGPGRRRWRDASVAGDAGPSQWSVGGSLARRGAGRVPML